MKKLIKFALVAGAITAAARLIRAKKQEWEGLTEAEARAKIQQKLPDRVPANKAAEAADKIVAGLRSKGMLSE